MAYLSTRIAINGTPEANVIKTCIVSRFFFQFLWKNSIKPSRSFSEWIPRADPITNWAERTTFSTKYTLEYKNDIFLDLKRVSCGLVEDVGCKTQSSVKSTQQSFLTWHAPTYPFFTNCAPVSNWKKQFFIFQTVNGKSRRYFQLSFL